jgi:pimeloyl-ACP methyl ester carboxylesterase
MGGYVAWEFWRRHRTRLARLVLCDTRAIADSPEGAKGRLDLAAKVLAEGSMVAADAMLPKLLSHAHQSQSELVVTLREMILRTPSQTIAAALRGLAQRADFSGLLSQIDVPALVICGEQDAISPPAEMRGIAAALPSAKYVEIAGAGHMAPLESPEAVNAALRKFLAG